MSKSIHDHEAPSPLNYPGERHDSNFLLLDGEIIMDVSPQPEVAIMEMDTMLKSRGLALIAERIPVLAFGRNASPQGAVSKTNKYSRDPENDSDTRTASEDLGTIPMLKGLLRGHDVVWHGRPGQTGGYFAELINTPDVPDASVEVWVQFLTNEQLAVIHTTEGPTYEVSEIPGVQLSDTVEINTIGYTSRDASLLLADNQPVSIKGINRRGHRGHEMDVTGALEHTLGQKAVVDVLSRRYQPDTFINDFKKIPLNGENGRKAIQAKIQSALASSGLSISTRYEGEGMRFSRIDFGTVPRGTVNKPIHQSTVHLMEEYITGIRPSAEQLAQKVSELSHKYPDKSDEDIIAQARSLLDPAVKLRKVASDALLDTERERRLSAAMHSK